MPKINLTDTYRTVSGHKVRILCVDRKSPNYPVTALVQDLHGLTETVVSYTADGTYWSDDKSHEFDLKLFDPLDQFRNLPVDAPVWMLDRGELLPRHFSHVGSDGKVHLFAYGSTSHSGKTTVILPPDQVFLTKPKDAK